MDGIRMYELVQSPLQNHWEAGTRHPERDLSEPVGEAAFAAAVRGADPEIVHIHELARLPSSIIEQAAALQIPVVMTLHDYKPVCASVRLLDADKRRCMRRDVGSDCARNCADAPEGTAHLVDFTMSYERQRLKRAFPLAEHVDFSFLAPAIELVDRALRTTAAVESHVEPQSPARSLPAPAAGYQRRRMVNLERLNACERLIAPSPRVADIYHELGVDRARLTVQRLTLPHLAQLHPSSSVELHTPVEFVTLGGCAAPSKGSEVILEAVQALDRLGLGGRYRLSVLGYAEPRIVAALSQRSAVSFHGSYAPEELQSLLDRFDVGILPSTWEEVHGFVGIEMLAAGLPLIGSALGGITEYVHPGATGWLNRSATGDELATIMAELIGNPGEIVRLRESVRERRAHIVRPMTDHVTEVEALYGSVLEGSTTGLEPTWQPAR
jgi:glycosyltransferase involved in cell wall biosynthesis